MWKRPYREWFFISQEIPISYLSHPCFYCVIIIHFYRLLFNIFLMFNWNFFKKNPFFSISFQYFYLDLFFLTQSKNHFPRLLFFFLSLELLFVFFFLGVFCLFVPLSPHFSGLFPFKGNFPPDVRPPHKKRNFFLITPPPSSLSTHTLSFSPSDTPARTTRKRTKKISRCSFFFVFFVGSFWF